MPHFRPTAPLLLGTAAAAGLLALLLHAGFLHHAAVQSRPETLRLVERLELADLCLFPEAPHTRHPALVDPRNTLPHLPPALDPHPTSMFLRPPRFARTP